MIASRVGFPLVHMLLLQLSYLAFPGRTYRRIAHTELRANQRAVETRLAATLFSCSE